MPRTKRFLLATPVKVFPLLQRTVYKGIYALSYSDLLYIEYTRRLETDYRPDVFELEDIDNMPSYQTTIAELTDHYMLFDSNGTLVNPTAMIFDGYWSHNRVATMLPVDYEPATKK